MLSAGPVSTFSLLPPASRAGRAVARRRRSAEPRRRQPVLARPLRRARRGHRAPGPRAGRAPAGRAGRAEPGRASSELVALLRALARPDRRSSYAGALTTAVGRAAPAAERAAAGGAVRRRAARQPGRRWCAAGAARVARMVRDRISADTWRVLAALDDELHASAEDGGAGDLARQRCGDAAQPHGAGAGGVLRSGDGEHDPRPGLALPRHGPAARARHRPWCCCCAARWSSASAREAPLLEADARDRRQRHDLPPPLPGQRCRWRRCSICC